MFARCCKGCFGTNRRPSRADLESLPSEPGALMPAVTSEPSAPSSLAERRALKEWLGRSDDFDFDEAYKADTARFRSKMARSGVYPFIRWRVWRAAAGCSEIYRPDLYDEVRLAVTLNVRWAFEQRSSHDLSQSFEAPSVSGRSLRSGDLHQVDSSERERIEEIVSLVKQDLSRTFPCSEFYSDDCNLARLGNVIVSYAALNKDVGYCQGMNFLAGTLLRLSNSEQETFWMLTLVMVRYNLQSLFRHEIPLLHLLKFQFQALLKELMPELERHFERLYVLPELYAVKWFFSLFAYSVPENLIFPIWDFIFAGSPPKQQHTGVPRAMLLVALGIVRTLEKKLLKARTVTDVIAELEGSLRNMKSAEGLLSATRKLDRKISQASLEGLRGVWAELNPAGNDAISKGELVALLMPSAILDWEGLRKELSAA